MLIAVRERTREIGLRRALGAKRRDIRLQFMLESTMLAAGGGLAGVAVGLAAAGWRGRARSVGSGHLLACGRPRSGLLDDPRPHRRRHSRRPCRAARADRGPSGRITPGPSRSQPDGAVESPMRRPRPCYARSRMPLVMGRFLSTPSTCCRRRVQLPARAPRRREGAHGRPLRDEAVVSGGSRWGMRSACSIRMRIGPKAILGNARK